MDMGKLMGDQDHIRENLFAYVQAFSPAARDIFERFDFATQIEKLAKCDLLYQVTEKFSGIDLHPATVGWRTAEDPKGDPVGALWDGTR